MILKRRFKPDRRRRKRQLLNTSVQVFTGSVQLDGLGINLSDVGMCLFTMANLQVGSQIQVEFLPPQNKEPVRVSGIVAIALCICTESIFWWIQINPQAIGQT
jgi:hypothetical protein